MAEAFLTLSLDDRREALGVAADSLGRPPHLLEKDVWVVWALDTLFNSPAGDHLVFKGGTSLSKAYGIIQRFSEDVDLTYDIRAIAPDLVGDSQDAIPTSRGEERRWTKAARQRLKEWIPSTLQPVLQSAIMHMSLPATLRHEGEKLFIDYEAASLGTGYVAPSVMLEFGARATGEPASLRAISCDADGVIDGLVFPTANPRVMHAERTFWEKATAIHVFCRQQRLRGDRFARHWHDLVRLADAGIAEKATRDKNLAQAVANHKGMFFTEKDVAGNTIDYVAAVSGGLELVPTGSARDTLAEDYRKMVEDGLLLTDAEPFEELITRCATIVDDANRVIVER